MAERFTDAYKGLLEKLGGKDGAQGKLVQGVILIVFAVIEQFYVEDNFKCPCYNEKNCSYTNPLLPVGGRDYAIVFMVMTTVGATFVGFFVLSAFTCIVKFGKEERQAQFRNGNAEMTVFQNPPAQEQANEVTQSASTSGKRDDCVSISHGVRMDYCCKKAAQGLVIGAAWFCLLLIDGDYLACASTCNPYVNKNCTELSGLKHNELPFTQEYYTYRRMSQYIGAGVTVLVIGLAGLMKFCSCECCGCTFLKNRCCSDSCGIGTCCNCKYDEALKDYADDPEAADNLLRNLVENGVTVQNKAAGEGAK